jgi:glycosyltransferase involved in cell wall biosynthesis
MISSGVSLPNSLRSHSGPLVSVIVPTYGDSEYIGGALESIAAQTHTNIEIVVVDGSGVDWLSDLGDEIEGVEYVYQGPCGPGAARNCGIEVATGEMIAFLDADDRWLAEKLEKQLAAIETGADVVYSDVYIVENGTKRRVSALPVETPDTHHLDFLSEGGVPMPTVLVRKACFDSERFDESLAAAEDRDLWVRLFRKFRPARIPEPLACYHRRPDSVSSDSETMYESERASLAKLAARFPEISARQAELERRASYAHCKRLLRTEQAHEARHVLRELVANGQRDPRTLALVAVSWLPFGHQYMLRTLERVWETVR